MTCRSVLTVVASVLAGALLGLLLAHADLSGWFNHWRPLPPAPDRPTHIVEAYIGTVVVESATGKTYDCYVDLGDQCWTEAPQHDPSLPSGPACQPQRSPTHLRGTVDSAEICQDSGGGYEFSSYALRDDGSMYVWQESIGELSVTAYFVYPIVCAIVSFTIALALLFFSWFRRISTTGRLTTR